MSTRVRVIILVVVAAIAGSGIYLWATSGYESTDDAQVDAHVTPIAARVGGTVLKVSVVDNQQVAEGAELVVIDPRDYEIALARAQAELADARAEQEIAARYGFSVAKALLAQSNGSAEETLMSFVKGSKP